MNRELTDAIEKLLRFHAAHQNVDTISATELSPIFNSLATCPKRHQQPTNRTRG